MICVCKQLQGIKENVEKYNYDQNYVVRETGLIVIKFSLECMSSCTK